MSLLENHSFTIIIFSQTPILGLASQWVYVLLTDCRLACEYLTHVSLASHFWDIGKQRGVWSGFSLFAIRNISIRYRKKMKSAPDTPKTGNGLVQLIRMDGSTRQMWINIWLESSETNMSIICRQTVERFKFAVKLSWLMKTITILRANVIRNGIVVLNSWQVVEFIRRPQYPHSELPRPIKVRPRIDVRRSIMYEKAAFCSPEEYSSVVR